MFALQTEKPFADTVISRFSAAAFGEGIAVSVPAECLTSAESSVKAAAMTDAGKNAWPDHGSSQVDWLTQFAMV